MPPTASLRDRFRRPLHDLRLSVTDRCNFRCTYCMPKQRFGADYRFMPRRELLSFEEIERLVRIFAGLGVCKIRLTGGEPLLRQNIAALIALLSAIDGVEDLSLTTNGSLLTLDHAHKLKAAGLQRMTVSLDAIDEHIFKKINDVGFSSEKVLSAIDNAEKAGLAPIKINMVVKRNVNDGDIVALAERFRGTPHIVRFIEYMDVGNTNRWHLDEVVAAADIVAAIDAVYPLAPIGANYTGEVARRWRYRDGQGEIGVISSVTQPFCSTCTRARLSADGKLYLCLFARSGHNLKQWLRDGTSDAELRRRISAIWGERNDRYSLQRAESATAGTNSTAPKIEMSYIGG